MIWLTTRILDSFDLVSFNMSQLSPGGFSISLGVQSHGQSLLANDCKFLPKCIISHQIALISCQKSKFLSMARQELTIFLAGMSWQEKKINFWTREILAKHPTASPYPAKWWLEKKRSKIAGSHSQQFVLCIITLLTQYVSFTEGTEAPNTIWHCTYWS